MQNPDAPEKLLSKDVNWKVCYGEIVEEDPAGMPTPLGKPVKIRTFLDADLADNVVTRRSHTGIFIFVNNSLIVQYSKKQNAVEPATFGAEMVAIRVSYLCARGSIFVTSLARRLPGRPRRICVYVYELSALATNSRGAFHMGQYAYCHITGSNPFTRSLTSCFMYAWSLSLMFIINIIVLMFI